MSLQLFGLPTESVIAISFIVILFVAFNSRFSAHAAANGPTILTTCGILATFIGIAIGLSSFDSTNIQASIPDLLNGLKTAFWASVVGVGCALLLKLRDQTFGHREDERPSGDVQDVGAAELLQGIGRVERALVGGEEGSLISQLKFLRTETRDELRQLREAQTKALEKLSEMGSKTLIEALKDVIRDFNEKLTEQFGENFKELNAAVGKLVEWQEAYRRHIEATTESLRQVEASVAKAAADYSMIVERSGAFADTAKALSGTIQEMDARQVEMRKQSEALTSLLREASGALPEIEKKMVELARQLSDGLVESRKTVDVALTQHVSAIEAGVKIASEGIKKHSEESAKAVASIAANTNEQLAKSMTMLSERIDESQKSVSKALSDQSESVSTWVRKSIESTTSHATEQSKHLRDMTQKTQSEFAEMASALSKSMGDANQSVVKSMSEGAESLRQSMRGAAEGMSAANAEHNRQLSELASKTKDQVAVLDKALGEELERSLQSLGRQLTALSEKFVADYLPLTDRLRQIVDLAKRSGA